MPAAGRGLHLTASVNPSRCERVAGRGLTSDHPNLVRGDHRTGVTNEEDGRRHLERVADPRQHPVGPDELDDQHLRPESVAHGHLAGRPTVDHLPGEHVSEECFQLRTGGIRIDICPPGESRFPRLRNPIQMKRLEEHARPVDRAESLAEKCAPRPRSRRQDVCLPLVEAAAQRLAGRRYGESVLAYQPTHRRAAAGCRPAAAVRRRADRRGSGFDATGTDPDEDIPGHGA